MKALSRIEWVDAVAEAGRHGDTFQWSSKELVWATYGGNRRLRALTGAATHGVPTVEGSGSVNRIVLVVFINEGGST